MRTPTAFLLCVVLGSIPAGAGAAETPEGVLAELEIIYAAGDADAYGALLADDYEYVAPNGHRWARDKDLTLTTRLLETADVRLTITRDFSIHPGDEPDTWVLENVPLDLTVTKEASTNTVHAEVTLSVRRDPATGAFRIFRWAESDSDE